MFTWHKLGCETGSFKLSTMNSMNAQLLQPLTVRILDDNPFYANLLENQIRRHIRTHFGIAGAWIDVQSYTDHTTYVQSFQANRSLAFVDYYLGGNLAGTDLIQPIQEIDRQCSVIILTDTENLHIVRDCMDKGAGGLIFKTSEAVFLCAAAVQNALNNCTFQ